MCPLKRCRFLEAAKAIIDERRCLEWGYVPSRDLMGYYWKGEWVGGDTVDDAIHFIADQIDASQSPKSMPSCCREQALVDTIESEGFDCPNLHALVLATPVRFSGRVLRPADGKDERSGGEGLKRS
jgi:hypothetical protein